MNITDIVCSVPVELANGEWLQRFPSGRVDGARVLVPHAGLEVSIPAERCTWRQPSAFDLLQAAIRDTNEKIAAQAPVLPKPSAPVPNPPVPMPSEYRKPRAR